MVLLINRPNNNDKIRCRCPFLNLGFRSAIHTNTPACGVDVVALKRSMAFGLLKSRAYRAIYDAVKTPRSDIDHSLSPKGGMSTGTS